MTSQTFIADRIARERHIDLYAAARATRAGEPRRRWIAIFSER